MQSLPRVVIASFFPPNFWDQIQTNKGGSGVEMGDNRGWGKKKKTDYRKQIVKHKHQSVDRSKNRKSVPRSWIHERKNGINDSLYFACHSWT